MRTIHNTNSIRPCHDEKATKNAPFVVSLSTACTPGHGGNFYIQDHGILVKNALNTLIVHCADALHGTTVHDVDFTQKVQTREHRGFSMLISRRIKSVWKRHCLARDNMLDYDSQGRFLYSKETLATLDEEERKNYSTMLRSRGNRKWCHESTLDPK